jgi:hypothetical protein
MGAAKILIGGKKLRNLLKKLTLVDASGKVLSQRSRCGSYIVVKEMERITVRTTLERNLLLEKNPRPAGDLKTVTPELMFDKLGKIIHSLVWQPWSFANCSLYAHHVGLDGFHYPDHICSFSCHGDNCEVWQVIRDQRKQLPMVSDLPHMNHYQVLLAWCPRRLPALGALAPQSAA